jgi:4-hydroxy-tetrahydrodipicolinate reductase
MIKVAVTGASGKMGSRIIRLLAESPDLELCAAIEREGHASVGRDAGESAGSGHLGVPVSADFESAVGPADVLIDFTEPSGAMRRIEAAARKGKAVVIGTTGFSEEQLSRIRALSKDIPCVLSPNMSVGVNILFKLLGDVARVTGEDYDVEIVEMHHRHKKDAPSGTAMKMARILAEALKRDLNSAGVYGRHGMVGERKKEEIGIQSLRGGDVVGDHTVIFAGPGERIELTHKAQSRDNFARGALIAARWAVGRQPGLYDMQDVLGFRIP